MNGLTLDRIEPLCQRLFVAIKDDKENDAQAIACELLAGFLCDINKLAWFAQEIAGHLERKA